MSLQRELLIIACAIISFACLTKAGFLTIERFLIVPSTQPLIAQAKTVDNLDAAETSSHLPSKIVIPSHQIELPIVPSSLLNGDWQVTDKGVSLLNANPQTATDEGLIMYGHNWPSLLGRLQKAHIGEAIIIAYPNDRPTIYTIESIFKVAPDQLNVLDLAKPNTLLLYTCTGFLDNQRLVVLATKN